jgi:hypothetical protein
MFKFAAAKTSFKGWEKDDNRSAINSPDLITISVGSLVTILFVYAM